MNYRGCLIFALAVSALNCASEDPAGMAAMLGSDGGETGGDAGAGFDASRVGTCIAPSADIVTLDVFGCEYNSFLAQCYWERADKSIAGIALGCSAVPARPDVIGSGLKCVGVCSTVPGAPCTLTDVTSPAPLCGPGLTSCQAPESKGQWPAGKWGCQVSASDKCEPICFLATAP